MSPETHQTETANTNKSENHSYAKLAVATFTSPRAAYEEILKRRLLGSALIFVSIAGVLFCLRACLAASELGPLHYFATGRYNPITWFGLFLLYAWAAQKLLKWIGTEIDYVRLVIIMGWAQLSLILVGVMSIAGLAPTLAGTSSGTTRQLLDAASAVLQLAYVVLIAIGINVATGAPVARGIMTYVVVSFASTIAFGITYGNSRLKLFEEALPGIAAMAQQVAASDGTPWLAAAAVGLYLGVRDLGRELGWERSTCVRGAISAALTGALAFGIYLSLFVKADYYGNLLAAQRDYELGKIDRAVKELKALIPASKYAAAGLILDIADIYYLSGKPILSRAYYRRFVRLVHQANLGDEEKKQLARPLSGIGATYDLEGKYNLAIEQFKEAADNWPEFRDPWVRLALTYNRLGDYKNALASAEHASTKLKSEAPVLYVAILQAQANLGNVSLAKKAYEELKRLDDELAKKIGNNPRDWRNAVAKLAPKDLKFPLEKEVVAKPERATEKPRKSPRK